MCQTRVRTVTRPDAQALDGKERTILATPAGFSGLQGKALGLRKEDYPTKGEVMAVIPKHCLERSTPGPCCTSYSRLVYSLGSGFSPTSSSHSHLRLLPSGWRMPRPTAPSLSVFGSWDTSADTEPSRTTRCCKTRSGSPCTRSASLHTSPGSARTLCTTRVSTTCTRGDPRAQPHGGRLRQGNALHQGAPGKP